MQENLFSVHRSIYDVHETSINSTFSPDFQLQLVMLPRKRVIVSIQTLLFRNTDLIEGSKFIGEVMAFFVIGVQDGQVHLSSCTVHPF